MDERSKLIGRIHGQKRKVQVCLSCGLLRSRLPCPCGCESGRTMKESEYRAFLQLHGGKPSCSQMDLDELKAVSMAFDEVLGNLEYWERKEAAVQRKRQQTIRIIRHQAREVLGEGWQARLDGFVAKTSRAKSLSELNDNGLRQVIGCLRRSKKSAMDKDNMKQGVIKK